MPEAQHISHLRSLSQRVGAIAINISLRWSERQIECCIFNLNPPNLNEKKKMMTRHLNQFLILLISLVTLNGLFLLSAAAQTKRSSSGGPRVTKFEIREPRTHIGGALYITVGGQERKIHDEAIASWIINDGRQVIYSSTDGAGGFENKGQSLRIYHVKTRHTQKILSEYFGIWQVIDNGTLSKEEKARGLSSSTFGMRFEGDA